MAFARTYTYTGAPGQVIGGGRWPGGLLSGPLELDGITVSGSMGSVAPGPVLSGTVTLDGITASGTFSPAGSPVWIPEPGGVTTLTRANGRLTNSFVSTAAPYFYQPTVAKIRNDYSTAILNPHFGQYGAILFFGAGHAASSDNTLIGLVLGATNSTFRRFINPTPINGIGSDSTTQTANTLAGGTSWATDWADTVIDQKPAAPHSYGVGDIIGPSTGGAVNGTFFRTINSAAGYGGDIAAEAAHRVDFNVVDGYVGGPGAAYTWARVSKHPTAPIHQAALSRLGGPNWTAYVASQQRVYYEARAAGATIAPRWYDIANDTWNTGSGTPRLQDGASAYGETGVMFCVPERSLVVFAYRGPGSILKIQYLDVSQENPGWTTPTISNAPGLVEFFATACWCPDNERIIVGELADGNTTLCEVAIPTTLSDPWVCENYTISTGIAWVTHSSYKSWSYHPGLKVILYPGLMSSLGSNTETIYVHRPRGT